MSEFAGMAMERLEAEICESAAHLTAAECRWSLMIGEFDRRDGAGSWGCLSTAHFLNWRCGLALGAARERVRVARRLDALPLITAKFSTGELSYSKVRALTRVASPADEEQFVALATAMTAEQLERLLRGHRRAAGDDEPAADVNEIHRRREFNWHWDDDGSLVVKGRLAAEDGALLLAALSQASDTLRAEAGHPVEEGPRAWDGWAASQADALGAMAETVLAGGLRPAKGASRHQVVVHVDAETIADDRAGDGAGRRRCHLQDGPALSAETVRRLACDAGTVFMLDGPDGAPVNVSRRSSTVSAALARALKARDGGCRFPGCTHHRFVDNHHIRHRANKGETTLANMLQVCRSHHRLVHEGGWRVQVHAGGGVAYYRPDGTPLDSHGIAVTAGDDHIREANAARGVRPTPDTPVPDWDGERPDYGYIIQGLLYTKATTPKPPTFPRERPPNQTTP